MRPEGWNKGGNPVINGVQYHNYDEESYEAGADAILEELKKEGDYCNPCSLSKYWGKKGWLAFIPDDKLVTDWIHEE